MDCLKEFKCPYVAFPNHPFNSYRKKCNTLLFKLNKSVLGKEVCTPVSLFCYNSIIKGLENFFKRDGFYELCQHWRHLPTSGDVLHDIYDGRVWKDFQVQDGLPLLKSPSTIGLMLNLDFFQPFKHTAYSVGAIYLGVMNLPREKRFLSENILLVGIIPGPHEPKSLNFILRPLVDELNKLWHGVNIEYSKGTIFLRALLLSVACDSPAARKVAGYSNYNALKGCLKCLKEFPYINELHKPNYGGFDVENWERRCSSDHHKWAKKWQRCKTLDERKLVEKSYGVKYSILLELPYFDPSRMVVIDPMHNLLLGTGKKMIETWKETDLLTNAKLQEVQKIVDSFACPSDIGRIPFKIASGFAGFTADQWKNWILVFSLVCL